MVEESKSTVIHEEKKDMELEGIGHIELGEDGEYYLITDALDILGWTEGDELEWTDNQDGTFTLKKVVE